MKAISDGAIKMYCYELHDFESGAIKEEWTCTIKAITIPSPWNRYPKAQIASALVSVGSIIASVLKAIVPTSICQWFGGFSSETHIRKHTYQRED